MKKENKQMAQKRKAKQREKNHKKQQIWSWIKNWGPIVAIVLAAILMIVAIATSDGNTGDYESVEDDSEISFSLDGGDGDDMDLVEWEEVDEDDTSDWMEEELDTTSGTVVKNGDTVDIDFVGTVDGVPFEGGDTEGGGYELTLGSGEFIDGFEDAIVGHAVGETFDVKVTFPDPYLNDTSLSGKEAVFSTTINGVYK